MGVFNEVAKIVRDHIARAKLANTHPAKLLVLSNLLKELFQVKLEELIPGIETKLGSKIWGLKGSADLLFSNVVFEVKVDLDRELDDAKWKLKKYLQALHEREPWRKSIGIATDSVKFKAYAPVIKDEQVVELSEIGSINIAESTPSESVLWLDSFIFSTPKIRPSAQDLRWRFGPGSPTYSIARDSLQSLWHKVEGERNAKLKLDLWAKNMEIVYGSKPGLNSFIDHTYLVTLVKLIVYFRLSGDNYVDEKKIMRALTGEYFSSCGIANLIEEDFFTWILSRKIASKAVGLVCDVAKELLRYDFSQVDEDFFKEIYQEIVERGERHRIGEYYTPEWLVQLILKEAIDLWKGRNQGFPRILDPACGSGTFLCNAIHMAKEELQNMGKLPDQVLEFIVNNIVGVDVNPLAVIIARANYLIALGDLLKLGKQIIIPVYVADSIRMPKVLTTLATKGLVEVYEVEVDGHCIQIPKSVIVQKAVLSQVFEAFKDATSAYKARADRNEALKIFRRRVSTSLAVDEFEILNSTLNTILTLMDKGLDSIWIFMLKNIYAPIALTESKFDIVVGNPPWIAMKFIENKSYQEFVKQEVLAYGLLDSKQVKMFANMEVATLFFCKSVDLYLNNGGIIAFVMPRSILTGALHHINFKLFKRPQVKLIKIFDLEDVYPLFNVPACSLIAIKGERTFYPILARRYSGKLPEKNIRLIEAIKHFIIKDYMYKPPTIPLTGYSEYYNRFKRGADIYPRNFWLIDFIAHPTLGINTSLPYVRTSEEAEVKERWKDVKLEGNVEANFVYATLLSKHMVPFGYFKLTPIIVPIERTPSSYRLLDDVALRNAGYVHMANWFENVQKWWRELRTERDKIRFPSVLDRLDYNSLLSTQNPSKRYVVLYNTSGTNVTSCVIDKDSIPSFRVLSTEIKPVNFIADTSTYIYETNVENEAHYLCAALNSNVINEIIKPLQPKGLFGERSIHRRPFMLPIPKFNENEHLHVKLAELSKKCHVKVASIKFTKKSTASLRKEARKSVEKEIIEIDKLVSQLLGL